MTAAAKPDEGTSVRVPPWMFLLIGLAGGGGTGTLLSSPVWGRGEQGLSRAEVKAVVEEVVAAREKMLVETIQASNEALIEKSNEATLNAVRLMLAEDKLERRER